MRALSAFIAAALAIRHLAAQGVAVSTQPQVVTTGVGEASVVPDRAEIFVSIQTRASTVASASADNARRARSVLDTLRVLGITGDAVSTASYSVSPEMQYPPNQPPRTSGYTVSNSIVVKLKRIEDVGRTIDAVLAKGANEISSLQFSSSKADSVRAVALSAAVADARVQAEVMAKAAGGSLGALIELNTSSPVRPIPLTQPMAMMRAATPTPIVPGAQTVNATVNGRWVFVPAR